MAMVKFKMTNGAVSEPYVYLLLDRAHRKEKGKNHESVLYEQFVSGSIV